MKNIKDVISIGETKFVPGVDHDFTRFVENERKQMKGKMRLVNEDFAWLKKGDAIILLDINVTHVHIKSMNTGYSGWLWRTEMEWSSEPIEGGV